MAKKWVERKHTDYSLCLQRRNFKIRVRKNDIQVRRRSRGTTAQMIYLSWLQAGVVAGVCPSGNQLGYRTPCWYNSIWHSRGFSAGQIHCTFIWKDGCWRQAHFIKLTQRGTQGSPGDQAFVHFTKSIEQAEAYTKNQNYKSKSKN